MVGSYDGTVEWWFKSYGLPLLEIYQRLREIIEKYGVAHEKRQLNSGEWSDYYCNLKSLLLTPVIAWEIARLMYPYILESGVAGVGGLETGAIPLTDAICSISTVGSPLPGFFVRKANKSYGIPDRVVGGLCADGPLIRPGRDLAVVEDVVSRGGSALEVVRAVRAEGCEVKLVMGVLERHEGGGKQFRDIGIPFKRLFYTTEDGRVRLDEETNQRLREGLTRS